MEYLHKEVHRSVKDLLYIYWIDSSQPSKKNKQADFQDIWLLLMIPMETQFKQQVCYSYSKSCFISAVIFLSPLQ